MRFRASSAAATFVALCLISTRPAAAQTATGTIIGHITDSSGAVLPQVDVSAFNPANGFTARTVSDEQGIYRLFYLAPGSYDLTFERSGFAKFERTGLELPATRSCVAIPKRAPAGARRAV